MVVGISSNFIEGFEDITVDDNILLNNFKKAIEHTKLNKQITDPISLNNNYSGQMPGPGAMPSAMPGPGAMPGAMPSAMPSTMPGQSAQPTLSIPPLPSTQATMQSINKFNNIPKLQGKHSNQRNHGNQIKAAFADIKNDVEDDDDEDDDDDDDDDDDEEHFTQRKQLQNIEPFYGSKIIESSTMKNLLLALLITFLAYIVAYIAMKDLFAIVKYLPHIKKFKNFIYWALLFGVIYLCLELF